MQRRNSGRFDKEKGPWRDAPLPCRVAAGELRQSPHRPPSSGCRPGHESDKRNASAAPRRACASANPGSSAIAWLYSAWAASLSEIAKPGVLSKLRPANKNISIGIAGGLRAHLDLFLRAERSVQSAAIALANSPCRLITSASGRSYFFAHSRCPSTVSTSATRRTMRSAARLKSPSTT